jgi:hypothetical protein
MLRTQFPGLFSPKSSWRQTVLSYMGLAPSRVIDLAPFRVIDLADSSRVLGVPQVHLYLVDSCSETGYATTVVCLDDPGLFILVKMSARSLYIRKSVQK